VTAGPPANRKTPPPNRVSLITTVRNESASIDAFLDTIASQTRPPDEIVILDGGSTDGTVEAIERRTADGLPIRLIVDAEANIARGRNLAIAAAQFDLIAATDAGCRLAPDWLEHLVRPLCEDPSVDVASGFYRLEPHSFFEHVNGLLTLPGQLEPIDPERFLPSGRSVAFRKRVWAAAGGYPEWLYTAEDTLFDRKLQSMGCRFVFVPEAVVHWRPRRTLRRFAKQFYLYGVGSGRRAGFRAGYWYTIRQHLITALLVVWAILRPLVWAAVGLWTLYYIISSVSPQARLVRRRLGSVRAGLLALVLIEVRRLAGASGFLVGTFQRVLRPGRYKRLQEQYFRGERRSDAIPTTHVPLAACPPVQRQPDTGGQAASGTRLPPGHSDSP